MAAAEVLKVEMEMSRNNLSYCQIITAQMVSELCIQGSLQANLFPITKIGTSYAVLLLRQFHSFTVWFRDDDALCDIAHFLSQDFLGPIGPEI